MTRARVLADYVAGGTTAAEFDHMDGVTSNVQTQLNAKAPLASPTFTGTTTVSGDLVPSTPLSHRNMIINGGMQVAQRGTSSTSVTSGGYKNAPDRFTVGITSIGTYTISQSTDAPAGFAKSYKIDRTTADASPNDSSNFTFETRLEGQDLQSWKKGTSSALPVTLSFWVKSNKTGNGQVNLRDLDNTRQCGKTYTISSANTWEYKTITFPANTTGAFGGDNNCSLRIEWWIDSGNNFKSGTTPTAWVSNLDNQHRNVGGTLNLADSTSNNFYITGIQLELGSNATPFEHRSYGDELIRCMRYFEWASDYTGYANSTSACDGGMGFKVAKRSTSYTPAIVIGASMLAHPHVVAITPTGITTGQKSHTGCYVSFSAAAGVFSQGGTAKGIVSMYYGTEGYLSIDNEL